MRFVRNLLTTTLWASALGSLAISCAAQNAPNLSFSYTTFPFPNAVNLGVESINDSGTISGYYNDAGGDTLGFLLPAGDTIETLSNPLDTTTPYYTEVNQIDTLGTVFGEFYDTATSTFSGFTYKNGTYTTYNVPNQPQYTTTALYGGNSEGGLCGFVFPPPYSTLSAFISRAGNVTLYQIEGAATSYCVSMNNTGSAAGIYVDSNGVNHGWIMSALGRITTVDFPGAASTPGTAPCVGTVAGTVVLGINDAGDVSGHFWDSSYNEHGFLRTASGQFYQLDAPGAYQTSGGGLNNQRQIVGHYEDSSCVPAGYTATYR